MKRISVLLVALALVAAGAWAQTTPTIAEFQTVFTDFTDAFAGSLMLNSTIGNDWSDGYIGGFPHFGVGLVLGSAFTGAGTADDVFNLLGQAVPQELERLGVPIPAVAATAKLGLPFIPVDIGVKAGMVPDTVAASLEAAYGVAAAYKNVGVSIRGRVLKEGVLVPELTLGAAGNYLTGTISSAIPNVTDQTIDYTDPSSTLWTITIPAPKVAFAWETKTVDLTAQISKKLLFLRPYVGAGYTLGSSTVSGGLSGDAPTVAGGTDYNGDGTVDLADLEAMAADAGTAMPDFSATGFMYAPSPITDPSFRVYGGLSVSILVTLDVQVMYVPATKNLGASLAARLQL